MGSYTFRWEQPANEVFVTGTFDDWAKSVKLDKKGDVFERTVSLKEVDKKIEYKFVVDGNWVTKDGAPGEYDGDNYNNILHPSDLEKSSSSHTMSSVGPTATTAALAGAISKEAKPEKDLPGAFPETPGATPAAENKTFSVNPIPSTEGEGNPIKLAPGEPVPDASTLTKNTLTSNIADDAELTTKAGTQTASINPIPASEGAGNPIKLAPGEPVPASSTINKNTLTSNVADDPDLKSSADKKTDGEQSFGVAPIPASSGLGNPIHLAAGEKVPDSSTFNDSTISSNVADDKDLKKSGGEQTFGVAPIPGTSGLGNPIHLAPGEKVPDASTFTTNTIHSNVADDKDLDAKADALPKESKGTGAGLFGVGPVSSSIIPESSLPLGEDATKESSFDPATISSVDAGSTTAALAGQVPKEPKTSINTVSSVGPTSTTAALAGEVSKEPKTSSNTISSVGPTSTSAALAGEVPKENVKPSHDATISSVAADSTTAALAGAVAKEPNDTSSHSALIGDLPKAADGVPSAVAESQKEAHASPEAAGSAEAVADKKQVEQELLKNVSEAPVTAESGSSDKVASTVPSEVQNSIAKAHASPEAAANAGAVADKKAVEAELTKAIPSNATETAASTVPSEVKDSIAAAHASPEATANKEAVAEKSAVESELQKKVPLETAAGEPAPTATAATSATAPTTIGTPSLHSAAATVPPAAAPAVVEKRNETPLDSRDVSPMSKAPTKNHPTGIASGPEQTKQQTQPTVTTGTTTSTAPVKSEGTASAATKSTPTTPAKAKDNGVKSSTDSPAAESSKSQKKKNRLSGFFGKVKDALHSDKKK